MSNTAQAQTGTTFKPRYVAALFQVDQATVGRWVASGKLKASQLPGGEYRISQDDLDEFIRAYALPPLGGPCSSLGSLRLYEARQSEAGRRGW